MFSIDVLSILCKKVSKCFIYSKNNLLYTTALSEAELIFIPIGEIDE